MRISAAILGAVALLVGVGRVAHAAVDLESKLTLALTISVTTDSAGDDDDTKITKVRFGTKEFMAAVDNAVAGNAITSVVVARAAVANNTAPPTTMLDRTMTFRDSAGATVAVAADDDLFINPLDTAGFGYGFLANTAEADNDKGDTNGLRNVKLIGSEGVEWVIDVSGNADAAAGADQIDISMLGFDTIPTKRKFDGATDLGLWFGPRSATVHGGFDSDANSGFGATAVNGVINGTVKLSAEKETAP